MAKPPPKAVIIGGSVGGLFIANMLVRQGWQTDVFERVGEGLASRGLGIARHAELVAIMSAAGAREPGPLGIAVTGRSAFDRSGKVIARFDYPQYLAAWSGVFNPLYEAFPARHYHRGRELVGIDDRKGKVVARFADGASIEADLIVGADGFRSTVRALRAREVTPSYAGYVAWRGIMEETDLSAEFRAHTFDQFAFCFPLGSQFIGYPVPGADESVEPLRRRYSFLWYCPVEPGQELADILTDATGHTHDFSIPPPLIRPAHIERLKRNAVALLPPQFAEVVLRSNRHMVQPIYDVESTRISFDRVALVGDAAFVARPHVGVGVLKAGEDALELARCLADSGSVAAALERYQSARLPVGRDTVRFGRRLGSFIERGLDGPWSDPDLGLVPENIIRVSARPVAHLQAADLGHERATRPNGAGRLARHAARPIGEEPMAKAKPELSKPLPFDAERLDRLLDQAGIDLLVVTSKHNIQYLLGGYRFFFFDYMDAIGVSRYLPVLIYQKGKPENAAYIGGRLETFEKELGKFWPPAVQTSTWGSVEAMQLAVEHVKRLGSPIRTIGVEASFLPADAEVVLRQGLGNREIVDAHFPLERLRACKTPAELDLLRASSERVVSSMLAVFDRCAPGMTKSELVKALRREEVGRDLTFEYCLVTAGSSLNRAPSEQRLVKGDIVSLDSGGNFHGYIGDLCRMGVLGEPDAELQDLLGVVEAIQQEARKPIRAGARGGDIFAATQRLIDASPHRPYLDFLAHGMGLVSHEAPRLTSKGPVPYDAYDEDRGLEAGMVISIETAMLHPKRGFIKLEDTVAVTADGHEGFGDKGRGWNRAGANA